MRLSTSHVAFNVEILVPVHGWRVCGFDKPHDTRDLAAAAMAALKAAAPEREFRVYPAIGATA